MKRAPKLLPWLCGSLALLAASGGCAHRPAEKAEASTPATAASAAKPDMKYKNVFLSFTVSAKGVAETDPKGYLAEAQTACVEQLTSAGLFDAVRAASGADPKEGAVIVQAELTSMRIVSRAARFWVGAMAGNSDMSVHVKLVDAATGSVVDESDISGDTNAFAGGWSIGGADSSLPARVGGHVAEYVVFKTRK